MTDSKYAFTSEIEALEKGLANAGIRKHTFGTPGEPDAFTLLEKRLKHRPSSIPEFELCQELCQLGKLGKHVRPFPNILSAVEMDDSYRIIMSYYEGASVRLENVKKHARLIAKALVDLNDCKLRMPLGNRMEALIESNADAPRPNEAYAQYLEPAIALCQTPPPAQFKNKLVKSHNDLFFPNIATEVYGDRSNVILIDLGHVAINEIGADFHHFLRASIINPKMTPALNFMIKKYVRLTKASKHTVLMNAHRFAILRLLERVRSVAKSKNDAQFEKELQTGWKLYEAAKSLQQEMQTLAETMPENPD